MLDVKLLGQFDVRRNGTPIALPSRPAQSLLAYLVLNAGTAQRREKLAGLLWPNSTEGNARSYLRHELWRLRKVIEPPTRRQRAAPFLLVDELAIEFDAHADYFLDAAILRAAPESSARALIDALTVYSGELLPGFYDDWVVLERERLQATFEQKMARLLNVLLEEQRWEEILDWGERWIALGHTPEPAYRALMIAHSARGDLSQVAAVCQRCTEAMRSQLGVEPSEQTRALFDQLRQGAFSGAPQSRADDAPQTIVPVADRSTAPISSARSNLPTPLTVFVGREQEIADLARLLSTTRLLTLTGSGGIGKTRLAIEVARRASEFRDGARWVELAALTDPADLPRAVAQVLDACDAPAQTVDDTLACCLASKQLLLVLDNCEHLIEACAALADKLLRASPGLKILATSREPLGISGETVWQVSSLCLPDGEGVTSPQDLVQCESAQLFVARARAVKSDFELTEENAPAVAQICRRLDGLPLAIELAAARINVLSAHEIAARLDDPFNLLTEGSRTALPRHQTLRAAMDWSYAQLTAPEQRLFRQLAILEGRFTLPAIEAAAHGLDGSHLLDLLTRLVAKSLVIAEQNGAGQTRYRMLETIREYAREKILENVGDGVMY